VSKKSRKGRNVSSKARRRHEKAQDRAAAIIERTENKVAKSKGQARTIQSRSRAWDDVNQSIPQGKKRLHEAVEDADRGADETSEFDDDMSEADQDNGQGEASTAVAEAANVPLPPPMDEDVDGIL
jgi:hypothetical protein